MWWTEVVLSRSYFARTETFAFYMILHETAQAGNTREEDFLRAAENMGFVN